MVGIHYKEILHELKVCKIVVELVVEEFQVLFVYNGLHRLGNGRGSLKSLCDG